MKTEPDYSKNKHTIVEQGVAALAYAFSSLLVIFINKVVLTTYKFPSSNVLALSQFAVTAVLLWSLKMANLVRYKPFSWKLFWQVMPVSALFLCNVASGLGGTGRINLPMFTVLRRFSILFAMILERYLAGSKASNKVVFSVLMMIAGAVVAGLNDLTFDIWGYTLIFVNDVFTAWYGVTVKTTLSDSSLSKTDLLFYNSVISFGGMGVLLVFVMPDEIYKTLDFEGISDSSFLFLFFLATLMGSVLNYSIFLCTSVNSALTTAVVGCLKNVLTTYLGMLLLGDYVFSWPNFIGVNVSILGSLVYSHAKFLEQRG